MSKYKYIVKVEDNYVEGTLGCKITQNRENAAIMTWGDAKTTAVIFKESGNEQVNICRTDGTPVGVYESVSLITLLIVAIAAAHYLKIMLENIQ